MFDPFIVCRWLKKLRTNGDGLNLDTILNVSIGGIVGILMREHILVAECVDEGGSAWRERCQLSLVESYIGRSIT